MPDSPDFPTRSSGLVRGIVIVLAVVVVVVAGGIVTSAVLTPPAATAPAATAPADPLTSRLDYQTSDFTQWTEQHLLRSEQEAIVSSPARSGYPRTARFIVAPGDHTSGRSEVERAEVAASAAQTGDPGEGKDKWFAWSSFFPAGTRVDEPDGWLVFTQWHQSGTTGVPNIAFELTGSNPVNVLLSARGGGFSGDQPTWSGQWDLGAIRPNAWVDFVVYIKWSTNPEVGHITVKIDGRQVADTAAATLYSGMSAYMKQGIYRANSARTQTIYHTGTRIGPTEASVRLATR